MFYLGKGIKFKKEDCKEYKTIKNALQAAAKDESLVVWDEDGKIVGGLTGNVPDGALDTNPDGTINVYDENNQLTGTMDASKLETLAGEIGEGQQDNKPGTDEECAETGNNSAKEDASENESHNAENNENEANTASETGKNGERQQDSIVIPKGTMKVTVICDGALNLRRSPAWGNNNICGRAVKGQSYYVKAIHTVGEKKMVQTIDDIYLSGQTEHVLIEEL